MTEPPSGPRVHERWAHLRFSVVGQLLAAPPPKGELRAAIIALAARTWQHPTTAEPVRFGFSTIERWYYRALATMVARHLHGDTVLADRPRSAHATCRARTIAGIASRSVRGRRARSTPRGSPLHRASHPRHVSIIRS